MDSDHNFFENFSLVISVSSTVKNRIQVKLPILKLLYHEIQE